MLINTLKGYRVLVRAVQGAAISLVLCGTFAGLCFAYFVVFPTVFEHRPVLYWAFNALMFYGYLNVSVLWLLLRTTDTATPMAIGQSQNGPISPDDENDAGGLFEVFYDRKAEASHPEEMTVCDKCGRERLPRSHHCRMCQMCVDVQDHHCLFVGRCVGRCNQKYFFYFTIWYIFGLLVALPVLLVYYNYHWSQEDLFAARWFDFPPMVTFVRFVLGHLSWRSVGLVVLTHCCFYIGMGTVVMSVLVLLNVWRGVTPYEWKLGVVPPPQDSKAVRRRLRDLFGAHLCLELLFPVSLLFDGRPRVTIWQAIR